MWHQCTVAHCHLNWFTFGISVFLLSHHCRLPYISYHTKRLRYLYSFGKKWNTGLPSIFFLPEPWFHSRLLHVLCAQPLKTDFVGNVFAGNRIYKNVDRRQHEQTENCVAADNLSVYMASEGAGIWEEMEEAWESSSVRYPIFAGLMCWMPFAITSCIMVL